MRPALKLPAAVLLLLPLAVLADALPSAPYVQVSGHGSLTVAPDIAHITVTVSKTDKDLALARGVVEHRASAVIAAARKLGVAERDIDAAAISIQPEYQWQNNSQVFIGQRVGRGIAITLRNLRRYADLIGALVAAGVTSFSTTMDRSDFDALRRQALAKAVDDAHARAAALAEAAGAGLGAVYSISESSAFVRPQPVMFMEKSAPANADGAEYPPGTLSISADVRAVYLLRVTH